MNYYILSIETTTNPPQRIPRVEGPFGFHTDQVKRGRELMAMGREVYWIDTNTSGGNPLTGVFTTLETSP
jgi:hypothetical protein